MKARKHRRIRGLLVIVMMCCLIYFGFNFGAHRTKLWLYPLKYQASIESNAKIYDLDPLFVAAVINVESRFKADAESSKGAKGLMQICDPTAVWASEVLDNETFEIDHLYNPIVNIEIGCWYLDRLRLEFGDKQQLILAAYNGGSGNVTKWLNNKEYSNDGETLTNIPFAETAEYVEKVMDQYAIYKELYGEQ